MRQSAMAERSTVFKRNKLFRAEIVRALKTDPKTTVQLYDLLKKKYPKYCDDTEICSHYALTPTKQPEWKHAVRCLLDSMKKGFLIYYDQFGKEWKVAE
jgi:hypothetical protein